MIRSACEIDYPPFCIVQDDSRAGGFSVELLKAACKAMGRDVDFRTGPWDDVKGWLQRGEVDALPLVGRTPEREAIFDFTISYVTMHGAIVVRKETTDVNDLNDLRGRRVATMRGDNAEEFLRREERGFEILDLPTFTDALSALSEGACDAVVVQRLVALRLIAERGFKNLQIVSKPVTEFAQDFCFAVKDGDRDTLALLNEGLALVIADGTHRRLYSKWFAALELPEDRPIVIGGDDNYPPFEFLDEKGQPTGYNVDLMRAIAKAVGMNIDIRLGPWTEIIYDLEIGKVDGIGGMFYSPDRDRMFDFSQVHVVNHCVSVVRLGTVPPPENVAALSGLSLVVQNGDIMHDFARQNGLTNRLAVVETQEDALRAVSEGMQDCALVSRMTALYWIEKLRLKNLTIGRAPLLSPEYCFAAPQGSKALLAQFSEGLKVLEQNGEYRRIHNKWMGAYAERRPSVRAILRVLAIVVVPLFFILAVVLLWSWSLRRQVDKQTTDLQMERARLQRAQRVAHIGDWELDLTSGTVDASEEARRIYGLADRELSSADIQQMPLSEYRDTLDQALRALVERGEAYDVEFRIRRPSDGALVDAHSVAQYDPQRKLVFGVVQDITRQKLDEAKLSESETRYRLIAENTVDCIWVMNMDLVFTYANPAVQTIFGFTPAEFVGTRFPDHCAKGHFQQMAALIQEKVASGPDSAGVVFESVLLDKAGKPIPVEIHGNVLFDDTGAPVAIQGVTRDIRERVVLEGQLRQAQKMESVGRLAGGVAHDFNNLLMSIMGYVELCRDGIETDHPVREWLDEVTHDAVRAAALVRQLMAFARKQTIAPKVFNLNDAVAGVLNMLRRLIGEGTNLQWQPGADVPAVKMDPAQLDQILTNLCVNARDAIEGVGKITVETEKALITPEDCNEHAEAIPGVFAVLVVSDDGCGMNSDTLANIFEPFFTTKGVGKGTGMGLATIYGIVKQNGGFVNVYSEPGLGTTFRIYLPRCVEKTTVAAQAVNAEPRVGGLETILLVEDEKSVRVTTRIFLQNLGYTVLAAEDPDEALRLAAGHKTKIDLVITDVVMPGMNGRELAARLAEIYPRMECLFMSGYTADVIAHHGILEKNVHFLSKPFSRNELARKVREVLDA